jgi:hypothetical protein
MMHIIFSPQGIGSFGLASDILGAYLLFKHIAPRRSQNIRISSRMRSANSGWVG